MNIETVDQIRFHLTRLVTERILAHPGIHLELRGKDAWEIRTWMGEDAVNYAHTTEGEWTCVYDDILDTCMVNLVDWGAVATGINREGD